MNRRGLLALVAVLAVLAVIVLVTQRPGTPSSEGSKLVPDLESALNDVDKVTITKKGNETVATLERQPSSWAVMERGGYPADVGKLRKGLVELAEAHVLEEKTSNPANYERLGVQDVAKDDAKGVAVSLDVPNRQLPTLVIGNADGTKYRYVRRADEAQSVLIDRNPDFPQDTSQWLDQAIVDVRPDRVQQVTIKHTDGEKLSVEKPEKGAANFAIHDVPSGRELLYPGVANVIGNSLRELKLQDVAPADPPAADAPSAHVEFRTFDGLVVTVQGFKQGDKDWITLAAAFDPDQAARFAPPAADEKAKADANGDAAPTPAPKGEPGASKGDENTAAAKPEGATPAAAKPADATPDVAAEAAQINERVGKWRYQIAAFQYDQMSRHMADLLKPQEDAKKAPKK